jgi:hypothetical protein
MRGNRIEERNESRLAWGARSPGKEAIKNREPFALAAPMVGRVALDVSRYEGEGRCVVAACNSIAGQEKNR